MSRKIIAFIVLALVLISAVVVPAYAVDDDRSFKFELSVDGRQTKEVRTGDIITVVFHLERTDAEGPYTMYSMQDQIRYDSNFFELVPGGEILSKGIRSEDIALRGNYREFYMNFLSFGGGEEWNDRALIGSFQLKVIATSGVTKITNQDYYVFTKDGSKSYECEANELTIILSTECVVRFETNGGSDIEDVTAIYGEKLERPADPIKEGKRLVGWYKDIDLSEEWNFETDTVSGNMTLYAKWEDVPPEEMSSSESESSTPPEESSSESEPSEDEPNDSVLLGVVGGIIVVLLVLLVLLLLLLLKRKREEDDE